MRGSDSDRSNPQDKNNSLDSSLHSSRHFAQNDENRTDCHDFANAKSRNNGILDKFFPFYFCKDSPKNSTKLSFSPKLARFIEPQSFALKAKNDELRLNSSSGGAFTLIAEYVLSLGGVVFGAAFDERLNVVHRFIEKPKQLELLRRSKYVESFIGESYKQALQFLKAGRLVLFSGVQCQIHALNSFLRKPYENLISVEVICNSVPSAKVWDIYKESLEQELGEKLQEFNFRGKNFGWEQGIFAVKTKTKTKILPHFNDIFLINFLNHTITRKSCANCYSKGFVSGADFTLGDFWGIRAWHADFVDDKGVSCVLAHTQKALNILDAVQEKCLLQKTRSSLVVAGNPALVYSNPLNPQRNLVLKEFFALYQQSKDAKKAVEFLKNCTRTIQTKKGFWQHYYRVYKDDPIRRAISKTLKRLQKAIFKPKEKKTIAIITFCSSLDNYGQVLQAYALQRYLRDNFAEFKVKFLHAHPFAPAKPEKKPFIKQIYEKIKGAERLVRTYFHAYIMKRQKYIQRLKKKPQSPKQQPAPDEKALKIHAWDKVRDFANFKKAHIALHNDELQAFSGFSSEFEADIYIVGSDQIWNDWGSLNEQNVANGKHWLDFYTLDFLPPNHKSKKIAYAASLGKREFASEFEKAYFQKALVKFDAISLREAHNIATLSEINLKSVCVPDPTQLLTKSDYEKLINLSIEKGELDRTKSDGKVREKSVFVYMLGNETSIDKDKVMQFLSTKESVIYTNANVDFSCAWDYTSDFAPTPQEWLACVRDCKLMITNSFHGCAFALTMNTPFVALKLGGGAEPMNTRFEQLFEIFGLQNRLVSNLNELKVIMNEPIEWSEVNVKLKAWRSVGEEFLERNVNYKDKQV